MMLSHTVGLFVKVRLLANIGMILGSEASMPGWSRVFERNGTTASGTTMLL